MFGLSFGELVMILIVAVVVLGPKELPRYLRKAGQLAGQLRRMAYEMREKSGIDEVLRTEGIDRDIAEIRKLARGEIADVVNGVRSTREAVMATIAASSTAAAPQPQGPAPPQPPPPPLVDREYPADGPDSYGAVPDTAQVYDGSFAPSPLADDPLYARGEVAPAPPDRDAGAAPQKPPTQPGTQPGADAPLPGSPSSAGSLSPPPSE